MEISKFNKRVFQISVTTVLKVFFRKTLDDATDEQKFFAVGLAVEDIIISDWMDTQKKIQEQNPKIVYYMSMEFLMGRALGNNLLSLGAYDEVKSALDEMGISVNALEDVEMDPALGNGGLGRLAACFLDSLSTLGYPAYGCGIRYQYGMFRQKIVDGFQKEVPDDWLRNGNPFEVKRQEYVKEIRFGGHVIEHMDEDGRRHFDLEGYHAVRAIPYDMPVVGYGNNVVNTLRVWDAEAVDAGFSLESMNTGDYHLAKEQEQLAHTIAEVLYPNDEHIAGKELRLKQQYFFISASIQAAIQKYLMQNENIRDLPDKIVFQLNDTHPTLTVPELMRILMDEYGLGWDDAWYVTTNTCAYTNHTIMSEALEKWPVDLFSRLLPRVYQIVSEINRRFVDDIRRLYPGDESKVAAMAILYDNQVRMANMAIVGSFSVNGVAKLHTEILKTRELKAFYQMMPDKFNNKTNGITQRRFLLHANPLLSAWVTKHIGDGWITDLAKLSGLLPLAKDAKARDEFMDIKRRNKVRLADYIRRHNGIEVDPYSIFDIQVKRLHEYKRQLLNILHVIYLYNELKHNPDLPFFPRTYIFGGKASEAYDQAKLIIKLINAVGEVVNNDISIHDRIKVVYIEDYRVSNAEIIFAAADISEQISTASREASGTGNMKFMLNGALTLGTADGANVEIVDEVGLANAFIFGLSAQQVIDYEKNGGYRPMDIYNKDEKLKKVIDQLTDGTFSRGDTKLFSSLRDSLLYGRNGAKADEYFILADFKAYCVACENTESKYRNKDAWAASAITNTAKAGRFSSDRTVQEYVDEIWRLDKLK